MSWRTGATTHQRGQVGKVAAGRLELNLEGVVVLGAYADGVSAALAGVVVGRADDARIGKERRVVSGGVGIEQSLEGVDEVLGRDRLAVAPLRAGAQMERIRLAVSGHVVAAGGARNGLEVLVEDQQRLEDLSG